MPSWFALGYHGAGHIGNPLEGHAAGQMGAGCPGGLGLGTRGVQLLD